VLVTTELEALLLDALALLEALELLTLALELAALELEGTDRMLLRVGRAIKGLVVVVASVVLTAGEVVAVVPVATVASPAPKSG
jgi:hypothetical protein